MLRKCYDAYGLVVESSFELPELDVAIASSASADVVVDVSPARFPVPAISGSELPPPLVVYDSPTFAFRVDGGRRIEVWEGEGWDREFTRAVLLGRGLAIALYQRGDWPLHVSAVVVGDGVWLFGGRSGAGKSTMAALLHVWFGLPLVSDDSGVVRFNGDQTWFSAASRAIRLLPDALPHTFGQTGRAENLGAPIPSIDHKVRVRLASRLSSRQFPVRGLVMLDDLTSGEEARVRVLRGARALEAIRLSMYRPWLGQNMCSAAATLKFCADFHRRVPIYEFARHRRFESSSRDLEPLRALMSAGEAG